MADTVCLALPAGEIGMLAGWTGVICYTLQIYFDFSGYSDMAIGLDACRISFPRKLQLSVQSRPSRSSAPVHFAVRLVPRLFIFRPAAIKRECADVAQPFSSLVFFATGSGNGVRGRSSSGDCGTACFPCLEDCGAIPDKLKGKRIGQLYTPLVVVLGFTLFRGVITLCKSGAMYAAMFSGIGPHWLGTAAVRKIYACVLH